MNPAKNTNLHHDRAHQSAAATLAFSAELATTALVQAVFIGDRKVAVKFGMGPKNDKALAGAALRGLATGRMLRAKESRGLCLLGGAADSHDHSVSGCRRGKCAERHHHARDVG